MFTLGFSCDYAYAYFLSSWKAVSFQLNIRVTRRLSFSSYLRYFFNFLEEKISPKDNFKTIFFTENALRWGLQNIKNVKILMFSYFRDILILS